MQNEAYSSIKLETTMWSKPLSTGLERFFDLIWPIESKKYFFSHNFYIFFFKLRNSKLVPRYKHIGKPITELVRS
jgi:hypothetical protein